MTLGWQTANFGFSRNFKSSQLPFAQPHYIVRKYEKKTLLGNQLALTIAPWSPMTRGSSGVYARYGQKVCLAKTEEGKTVCNCSGVDGQIQIQGKSSLLMHFLSLLPLSISFFDTCFFDTYHLTTLRHVLFTLSHYAIGRILNQLTSDDSGRWHPVAFLS